MALSHSSKRAVFRSSFISVPVVSVTSRSFSTPVDDTFSVDKPPSHPKSRNALQGAVVAEAPRHDWTKDEIREIYNTPLMELAFQAVGPFTGIGCIPI